MKKLAWLGMALGLAGSSMLLSTGPASAFGGETLGCQIQPSTHTTFTPGCGTSLASSSYTVEYYVQNTSGSYTYAWTLPTGSGVRVANGCATTDNWCTVSAPSYVDQHLTAKVTLSQGGATETLSSTAIINEVCGSMFC